MEITKITMNRPPAPKSDIRFITSAILIPSIAASSPNIKLIRNTIPSAAEIAILPFSLPNFSWNGIMMETKRNTNGKSITALIKISLVVSLFSIKLRITASMMARNKEHTQVTSQTHTFLLHIFTINRKCE